MTPPAQRTKTPRKAPTGDEWREAQRQARRLVKLEYPGVAHEADMIVDGAIEEALLHFTGGSFAALVSVRARQRALDRQRTLDVEANARVTIAAGMEVEGSAPDSTPPELDAKVRCAEITAEQTRDATTAECHRRFIAAVGVPWTPALGSEAPIVGSATPHCAVEAFREAAERAREMLRLARLTPTFVHMVDVAQLEIIAATCPPRELAKGARRYHYTDASGARRTYGETSGESAVLAILAGSWPRVRAGDLPEEIIDRKDANIRGKRPPTKPGKRPKRKSAGR